MQTSGHDYWRAMKSLETECEEATWSDMLAQSEIAERLESITKKL